MGDAAQSNTRNLYQKKFAFLEYRDGAGRSYAEQIRLQSWMNADDIPPQAQPSAPSSAFPNTHSSAPGFSSGAMA